MLRFAVGLVAILLPLLASAQGGPPLIVDDPGTPGDGHWEINLAGRWQASQEKRVMALPYVDLNYGWGDHVQLKFETGWATENEKGHPVATGLSNYLVGVKMRFLDEETSGVAVSTYPQAEFRGLFSSKEERINEDGTHLILPLEIAKSFGAWGVNPEFGIEMQSRGDTEYFYGVAMGYEVEKEKEVLWEMRGRSARHSADHEWLYNLGVRWKLCAGKSLIASAGHSVMTFRDDPPFFIAYLGTQIVF